MDAEFEGKHPGTFTFGDLADFIESRASGGQTALLAEFCPDDHRDASSASVTRRYPSFSASVAQYGVDDTVTDCRPAAGRQRRAPTGEDNPAQPAPFQGVRSSERPGFWLNAVRDCAGTGGGAVPVEAVPAIVTANVREYCCDDYHFIFASQVENSLACLGTVHPLPFEVASPVTAFPALTCDGDPGSAVLVWQALEASHRAVPAACLDSVRADVRHASVRQTWSYAFPEPNPVRIPRLTAEDDRQQAVVGLWDLPAPLIHRKTKWGCR